MQGEEDVSPKMVCTNAGLVQGAPDTAEKISLPFTKASATFIPLAMEPQVSYIL